MLQHPGEYKASESTEDVSLSERPQTLLGRMGRVLPLWKNLDTSLISEALGAQTSVVFLAGVGVPMSLSEALYQKRSRRLPLAGVQGGGGRAGKKLMGSGIGPLQPLDAGISAVYSSGEAFSFL